MKSLEEQRGSNSHPGSIQFHTSVETETTVILVGSILEEEGSSLEIMSRGPRHSVLQGRARKSQAVTKQGYRANSPKRIQALAPRGSYPRHSRGLRHYCEVLRNW